MQPKAIILDTDPGIGSPGSDVDDALAIVLGLLHPGCELVGLTIVAGNVPLEEGVPTAFVIDEEVKNKLITGDIRNNEFIKPLLRGKDIKKWKIDYKQLYLLYIPWKFPIDEYPLIKDHLNTFKLDLENRAVVKDGTVYWFALQRYASDYYHEFDCPKLIYPAISTSLFAVFDQNKFFTNDKCYIITSKNLDLKYIGTLMSSKTLNFIFKFLGAPLQGNSYNLNKIFVEQLPIYLATPEQQKLFIEQADKMLQLNKNLIDEINGFKGWLQRNPYNIDKFSKKLDKYYKLSLDSFLTELNKKKVDTKQRGTQELLKSEFEASINKINPLLLEIQKTDNEIDQMVYELYGLTDDEIRIVEESLRVI